MKKIPYKHNNEDIKFITDPTNTSTDIELKYGCGKATVTRWRKRYSWEGNSGSKPGVKKPWQIKRETRYCIICNSQFETIPSHKKKMCSRQCCGVYNKNLDKSYMQTEAYKETKRKPNTDMFKRYKNTVHRLSEQVYQQNKNIINPNNYIRTLAGVEGGYQLDHIITVRFGFDNNIPPEALAEAHNLRMLPWQQNLARNRLKN